MSAAPTKPRPDRAVRALALLHRVCERMDLANQMQRPTESTYQRAMAAARRVIDSAETKR